MKPSTISLAELKLFGKINYLKYIEIAAFNPEEITT
jgi:hypothetical protein